jgi:hypothetical protein
VAQRASAPGKRSPVEQAHVPAVQMYGAGRQPADAVHAAAARGVATPASPLPFGDTIQRAFGRHDISSVQAHTGPEAARSATSMGAEAYAAGDHVVLGKADLHTVAHEAAHVVQQRGGVQLKAGVGQAGDRRVGRRLAHARSGPERAGQGDRLEQRPPAQVVRLDPGAHQSPDRQVVIGTRPGSC